MLTPSLSLQPVDLKKPQEALEAALQVVKLCGPTTIETTAFKAIILLYFCEGPACSLAGFFPDRSL